MIGDRDLLGFRRAYYDLLVAFFWREPEAEFLASLPAGLGARAEAARELHPLLGEGWREIEGYLAGKAPAEAAEGAAEEYTRLFIGPLEPEVHPYESYYLTGRFYDRPLAVVREFLQRVGLQKDDAYADPEDALAFELEIARRLAGRQAAEQNPDGEARWANLQAEFLKQHLLVWAPTCAWDLKEAKSARFYRGVAKLLRGFLELELDLFRNWGPVELRSLDDARQSYLLVRDWKGPTFELPDSRPRPEPGAGPAGGD